MKSFLDKYDTVIFDMDGVITGEQNYWNSAALTVWEYLNWNIGIDINSAECMKRMSEIRSRVFCNDELISVLKGRGVNSNWDLGYVTVLISWIVHGKDKIGDFTDVLEYAETLPENILDAYDMLARKASEKTGFDYDWLRRNELMWKTMHMIFQGWFLGDELAAAQNMPPMRPGKPGLVYAEKPIIEQEVLVTLLSELSRTKRVCMGTGRPSAEIMEPLKRWNVIKYFDADGLCNYDHVAEAEKETGLTLTKPHPYMFLKALYSTDYDDKRIINGNYDRNKILKTLVVGDAGADMLAAQAMGADFCAVLTGVSGQAAKKYFEEHNADYILNSAADML